MKCLSLVKVATFPDDWLRNIDPKDYKRKVYQVEDNARSETGSLVINLLNQRFAYAQLDIEMQDMTKRQIWYIVDQKMNGIDLSGSKLQQYISLSEMIKGYCDKLTDFYGYPYWGLVLDEINVTAKARATILNLNGVETGLNAQTFPNFEKAPFFFLISEKEDTLKSMLQELKRRGYTCGFYGIITQGYGSTNVVRLLMRMSKLNKFYCFIAHDYDIDGIKICLDLKRYFDVESVGINPDMIERINVPMDKINQDYKGRTGNAKKSQVKGAINMLNELFGVKKKNKFDPEIMVQEYLKFKKWIEGCQEKKTELDALLANRLMEDQSKSKSRDLVDELERLLEQGNRVYDLNRFKEPHEITFESQELTIQRPEIIDNTMNELQELVVKPIKEYLRDNFLEEDYDWRALIEEKFEEFDNEIGEKSEELEEELEETRDDYIEENKEYTHSLKKVEQTLEEQNVELFFLEKEKEEFLSNFVGERVLILRQEMEGTPEYIQTVSELNSIKTRIETALDEDEIIVRTLKDIFIDLRDIYTRIENEELQDMVQDMIDRFRGVFKKL